ncbi:MAG: TonB-dependent receptor [Rhodospirillaceae bacterium]|nr:TonB-dependent receptor [Rhodospirillaceae bacterium]
MTALMAAGGPAGAQQNTAQELALEEIVVTAERREANLQTVPISVTAFTAAEIERRQITDTFDLVQFVPNLSVFHNASSLGTANAYYIRGIGNPESVATTDVPVGTYIDDIYVPRQQSANLNLFEVERVEVLRGPQGTLFGRNTTGGAVNIVSRKPEDDFYAKVEGVYGRFNRMEGRATVNAPLSSTVFAMVSAFALDDDGFMTSVVNPANDDYGEEEGWGVRGAFRLMPNDTVDWNISATRLYTANFLAGTAAPATLRNPVPIAQTYAGAWRRTTERLASCSTGETPRQWLANGCAWNEVRETAATSNIKLDFDGVTINVITGYRNMDHRYSLDFLNNRPEFVSGFLITNDGSHNLFSQEVKLSGALMDGRLNYVGGAFYMKEDNLTDFQDYLAFNRGAPGITADRLLENDTKSFAFYTQWDYDITDKLRLTAGVRWTQEDKTLELDFFRPTVFTEANIAGSNDFTSARWTPKVSVQYQFTEDVMAYASATNGFKSGGWNGRATNTNAFRDFREETVWSYEAGMRSDLLDDRLRLNVTAFWAEFEDLQINSAIPGQTPPVFIAQNSGDSRTKGLELEVSAVLAEGWTAFSSLGLQDAKFTRLSREALTAGFTLDSTVASSPDVSWAIGTTYERPVDELGGTLSFSASGDYTEEKLRSLVPTSSALIPETFIVNGGVTYERDDERWALTLECTNCLDKKYYITASSGGTQADPLRWGLRVRYRFD